MRRTLVLVLALGLAGASPAAAAPIEGTLTIDGAPGAGAVVYLEGSREAPRSAAPHASPCRIAASGTAGARHHRGRPAQDAERCAPVLRPRRRNPRRAVAETIDSTFREVSGTRHGSRSPSR